MKSKKITTGKKTYAEVIRLMQENKIENPTWSEVWLFGSYKYYQRKLATGIDKENIDSWWKGVIKSYNEKNGIK